MTGDKALRTYLTGALIVWIGLFSATTILLWDSGQLFEMYIVLGVGAFWSIVLAPESFRRQIRRADEGGRHPQSE